MTTTETLADVRIAGRYIPGGASPVDCGNTDAAIYTYEANGAPLAIAYHGTAGRHDWHFSFHNEEQRAARIAAFIESRRAYAEHRAGQRRNAKAPHNFEPGDIFHTCWGYDQTNVEFYQITRLIGKTMVELRELNRDSEETGFMSGHCSARPGDFAGEPFRRRVNTTYTPHSIRIGSSQTAWPWDGTRRHWSSYA